MLDEILQERLPERHHRRNKRGVKRKMSNFPIRRRTEKPLPPVNITTAIRIAAADSTDLKSQVCAGKTHGPTHPKSRRPGERELK